MGAGFFLLSSSLLFLLASSSVLLLWGCCMLLFVVWLLRLFVLSEVVGTVVGAGAVLSIGGECQGERSLAHKTIRITIVHLF